MPLDTATTCQILDTLRGLPRPVLEGFTKTLCKRFQVPEDASSIADRICQRQHHDWIETYFVQQQTVASVPVIRQLTRLELPTIQKSGRPEGHDHANRSGLGGLQCCGEGSSALERSLGVPRYQDSGGGSVRKSGRRCLLG
jgi:hypothetical protein